MNGFAWKLIGLVSKLLERDERDAVLGDLLEGDESGWRGMLDVSGLVFRRQAALWKSPRPWLAAFVVTFPCSYLLMRVSISVTCTYERLVNHKLYACWPTGHEGFPLLLCHLVLLIAWSWSGGYIVGSVSRRTLWMSAALSVAPVAFCLCMSGPGFPSRVCLFLFLLPAIFGVQRGLRNAPISSRTAFLLAATITALMISAWSNQALWVHNWALVLPAWYLAAATWRPRSGLRSVSHAGAGQI
ncbi:MAG: hypothetical protein JO300_06600 [Silvibacterium sp.]|nr:hypothetical protein [Silvibacterium sp.]